MIRAEKELMMSLLVLTIVFNFCIPLFAQENRQEYSDQGKSEGGTAVKTYSPVKSREECSKSFNINTADLRTAKADLNKDLLTGFFLCRAVIKDNIDECNRAKSSQIGTCQKYFKEYHSFFGRLAMYGRPSPQCLSACVNGFGTNNTLEECKFIAEAFLKKEGSICLKKYPRGEPVKDPNTPKVQECKAYIGGETDYCPNQMCKNKVIYNNAVRNRSINECDRIQDPFAKAMCRGAASKDIRVCEEDPDFIDFRNRYCE